MDKLANYRQLIMKLLSDFAAVVKQSAQPGMDTVTAFDTNTDNYLVINLGWLGQKPMGGTALHLRLHNGKIWIEEDMTDRNIAGELIKAGVPREDIVLGFQPPEMRSLTEFAVA